MAQAQTTEAPPVARARRTIPRAATPAPVASAAPEAAAQPKRYRHTGVLSEDQALKVWVDAAVPELEAILKSFELPVFLLRGAISPGARHRFEDRELRPGHAQIQALDTILIFEVALMLAHRTGQLAAEAMVTVVYEEHEIDARITKYTSALHEAAMNKGGH